MVILIEKGKIKSIARRVMSSHILGVWIPDYRDTGCRSMQVTALMFLLSFCLYIADILSNDQHPHPPRQALVRTVSR